MKLELTIELGTTWDLYAGQDPKILLVELMDSKFTDAGITNYKILEK